MNKELLFIGAPVEFKAGVYIYPPKVSDVILNQEYGLYSRVLTYSQEEIEDLYAEEKKDMDFFPTPIEFLLNNCYHKKEYELLCKRAFSFFLKQDVEFLYDKKAILIGKIENVLKNIQSINQLILITEEEFFDFQNLIRVAINQKTVERPNLNEHPRIKAMKAKARMRDRVKAKQAAKEGMDLFTIMTSICCMGIGITPLNIGEMSYIAMEAILKQYQNKEKYQVDIDSLLAGADSKKIKPKYWIRNLNED